MFKWKIYILFIVFFNFSAKSIGQNKYDVIVNAKQKENLFLSFKEDTEKYFS